MCSQPNQRTLRGLKRLLVVRIILKLSGTRLEPGVASKNQNVFVGLNYVLKLLRCGFCGAVQKDGLHAMIDCPDAMRI